MALTKEAVVDKMEVLDWGNNIRDSQQRHEISDFNKEYVTEMLAYWDNNLTNIL